MKDLLKAIAAAFALILIFVFICAYGYYIFITPAYKNTETTINTDSLLVKKPSARFAKPVGEINGCKLFEIRTNNKDVIYWTICNTPGVTASVSVINER